MTRASRRELLCGALGVALGAVLTSCAVEPTRVSTVKLARIGLLSGVTGDEAALRLDALRQGLKDLGYLEGRHVAFDVRYVTSDADHALGQARELIGLGAVLVVTGNPDGVDATRRASDTLPIVLAGVYADPVVAGVAVSLARPGGTVTGLAYSVPTTTARHLQQLKELVPAVTIIGWLQEGSGTTRPTFQAVRAAAEAIARSVGVTLRPYAVTTASDLTAAFGEMRRTAPDALLVGPVSSFLAEGTPRIVQFTREQRLPAMFSGVTTGAKAGALMAGGVDQTDLYRRAASYVDKILKGAKPGDLPIENPTKFDLVVNLKTATELGITVPQALLGQATEVIR